MVAPLRSLLPLIGGKQPQPPRGGPLCERLASDVPPPGNKTSPAFRFNAPALAHARTRLSAFLGSPPPLGANVSGRLLSFGHLSLLRTGPTHSLYPQWGICQLWIIIPRHLRSRTP